MRTIKYPADFLSPPSRAVFDMKLISSALNNLTPSNSVVFVGSPDFLKDTPTSPEGLPQPNLDSVEPWFNTNFTKIDIPHEVLSSWSIDDNTIKLKLPTENNFVPKTLGVHSLDDNHSEMPTQISNDNGKYHSTKHRTDVCTYIQYICYMYVYTYVHIVTVYCICSYIQYIYTYRC